MISKVWLINVVLVTLVAFFGTEAFSVWSEKSAIPDSGQARKEEKSDYAEKLSPVRLRNRADYELVATSNLFSPERKEFIPEETPPPAEAEQPEKEEVVEEKPLKELKEKIFLQGVMIMDGFKRALITNPYRKRSDDPKTLTVKEGDLIEELKVIAILPEKVQLQKGADRYEIGLYDEKKPPRSVVKAGNDNKQAPQVVGSSTETAVKKQGQGPQPIQVVESAKPETPPPSATSGKGEDPDYEYIVTPFGKIKRHKKK